MFSFRYPLMLIGLASLLACASQPATDPGVIDAPALHAQWWRTDFYGYDSAHYRLRHRLGPPEQDELGVELEYGASGPDFRGVEWPGSGVKPVEVQEHSADRCQVFGSLQSRCLYHDVVKVVLPPELLEHSRQSGLSLDLLGKSGGRRTLSLPGDYIGELLRAWGSVHQ